MIESVRALSPRTGQPASERSNRARMTLQLARFGLSGALVFVVYTGGTLLLSGPLGVPILLAIAVTYVLAIVLNFTLQRHFVFLDHDTFALGVRSQLVRYVGACVFNYGLTSIAVTTLPSVIGASQQVVFVGVVVVISLFTFTVLRGWIFHTPPAAGS